MKSPRRGFDYIRDYRLAGLTMREIALKHGVNISTVSRGIKRVERLQCPFGSSCTVCGLPECGIKDEYAYLVNNIRADKRRVGK